MPFFPTYHEDFGSGSVELSINDTAFDSLGGVGTEEESASKLTEAGNDQGLSQSDRARTDRGGKRVGDVVGTNAKGVHEGKEETDPKEKGVVVNFHHLEIESDVRRNKREKRVGVRRMRIKVMMKRKEKVGVGSCTYTTDSPLAWFA